MVKFIMLMGLIFSCTGLSVISLSEIKPEKHTILIDDALARMYPSHYLSALD